MYGSSATSVSTPIPGTASLIALIARQMRLSGLSASSARSVRSASGVLGNSATHGMPSSAASRARPASWSTLHRLTPGSEPIGSSQSCRRKRTAARSGRTGAADVRRASRASTEESGRGACAGGERTLSHGRASSALSLSGKEEADRAWDRRMTTRTLPKQAVLIVNTAM